MITLTLKEQPVVPLEAELLSPDVVASLSNDEIRALHIYLGKRQKRVADFFDVEGERSDELEIRGDATKIKWLGRGMSRGRLTIVGNAGMHLGAYMSGGTIEVSGNTTDWLGAQMTGGFIRIRGNAGGQVGAAYRGSPSGMTDGTIIVDGTAGLEVGMRMKRGIISVGGMVRDFAGLADEGRNDRPAQRGRASDRRMDDEGHDRLAEADSDAAHLRTRLRVQPDIHADVRPPPRDTGCGGPVCGDRRGLSALHGRRQCSRQGRNPGVEGVSVSPGRPRRKGRGVRPHRLSAASARLVAS